MNTQITTALAVAIALAAGTADAQTRVNPDRSADQLNARVLEVLQAREVAATAPAAPVATPAPAAPALRLTGAYLGANLGSNWQDNTDYTLGAVAGYRFHRNLAAEVTYDYISLGNGNNFNDGQMVMGNLVASYDIGTTGITPYVLAGAGVGWNGAGERATGDNTALYNVGGGVRLSLASRVELDARYRYVGGFDDTVNGNSHLVTAGLNFRF